VELGGVVGTEVLVGVLVGVLVRVLVGGGKVLVRVGVDVAEGLGLLVSGDIAAYAPEVAISEAVLSIA
jgi:hypothetical protein